jgi:PAS domain-containing protein
MSQARHEEGIDLRAGSVPDFVARKRTPVLISLASIAGVGLLLSCIAVFWVNDPFVRVFLLTLILGGVSFYSLFQVQRTHDLLMATEFQNALFSSAIGISHKFCVILKRDGTITYLDQAFQELFPNFIQQPHRHLDIWLEQSKVAREEREEISQALLRGGYSKIICVMRTASEGYYKLVLSVEPIVRPHGFMLLRGREFIDKRSANDAPEAFQKFDQLNRSFISLFSQVVNGMNMAVCMMGPVGNIIYANRVLEQWLGFTEGEIISCGFTFKDIMQVERDLGNLQEMEDKEIPIHLQMKHGGTLRVFLSQRVIRDESNKILGCVALMHSLSNNPVPTTNAGF